MYRKIRYGGEYEKFCKIFLELNKAKMDSIVSPHPALAQGPRPKVRDERRRCLTDCRPFLLLSLCGSPVPLTCGATATAAAAALREVTRSPSSSAPFAGEEHPPARYSHPLLFRYLRAKPSTRTLT